MAINLAKRSNQGWKHGAVIVKNNKIIGKGYNSAYLEPFRGHFSIHAEVSAIINAIKTLKNPKEIYDSELYIVQWFKMPNLRKNEIMRCSEPCSNCKRMIEKYKIKKVYYSVADSTQYFI